MRDDVLSTYFLTALLRACLAVKQFAFDAVFPAEILKCELLKC